MKKEIKTWIAGQKSEIEAAIVAAAENFLVQKKVDRKHANVLYDLRQSQHEANNLSKGKDLCYDRFTSGLFYSLWYQGRRINTSLELAIDFVCEAITDKKPIQVFDLGAGTGAVQIALGLSLEALHRMRIPFPKIRIVNVDISPFMLEYAQRFLIPAMAKQFPNGFKSLLSEYECISWKNPENIEVTTPYIVASYLFDHSDNQEAVETSFLDLVNRYDPECMVLLTSRRKAKNVIQFSQNERIAKRYLSTALARPAVLSGEMRELTKYRSQINSKYNSVLTGTRPPIWHEFSYFGFKFKKKAMAIPEAIFSATKRGIDLYGPPIRIRRDVVLSEEQKAAAVPNKRPTIIYGSAGSGKSVVITERIKNLIERHNYGQHLRILLTTFNLELVEFLKDWMVELLSESRITRSGGDQEHFHFDNSPTPNLTILNFDKLPTRIGHIKTPSLENSGFRIRSRMEEAILRAQAELGFEIEKYESILDLQFLLQEHIRVIYGQLVNNEGEYQTTVRHNRPHQLAYNSEKRRIIWRVIAHFQNILREGMPGFPPRDTIYTRREKFYRQLIVSGDTGKYTHLFVDEFQDCTYSDFQIFYGLLSDNNQLVIGGDFAQAVHLGSSVVPPREDEEVAGEVRMKNRAIHTLSGSYRLPFRISECIRPLCEKINKERSDVNVDIITPYKGAPPGARPILLYADSEEKMAKKMLWLLWQHQIFDLVDLSIREKQQFTILEKDKSLCQTINGMKEDLAKTDTILRLKGMEKNCIVWSTRISVDSPGDENYYIYTILTRTRSLLIIALFDETPDRYLDIIRLFDRDRLLIWDEETEGFYEQRVSSQQSIDVKA